MCAEDNERHDRSEDSQCGGAPGSSLNVAQVTGTIVLAGGDAYSGVARAIRTGRRCGRIAAVTIHCRSGRNDGGFAGGDVDALLLGGVSLGHSARTAANQVALIAFDRVGGLNPQDCDQGKQRRRDTYCLHHLCLRESVTGQISNLVNFRCRKLLPFISYSVSRNATSVVLVMCVENEYLLKPSRS